MTTLDTKIVIYRIQDSVIIPNRNKYLSNDTRELVDNVSELIENCETAESANKVLRDQVAVFDSVLKKIFYSQKGPVSYTKEEMTLLRKYEG
jgi:hypothetical protein